MGNFDPGVLDCCCHSDDERKSHHSHSTKANLNVRLNRIEGQIRGVKRLIEKDTYCDHVLTQIAAVHSALNGVGKILLQGHFKNCIVGRVKEGDEVFEEFLNTVSILTK